jgi:hypothetical protein
MKWKMPSAEMNIVLSSALVEIARLEGALEALAPVEARLAGARANGAEWERRHRAACAALDEANARIEKGQREVADLRAALAVAAREPAAPPPGVRPKVCGWIRPIHEQKATDKTGYYVAFFPVSVNPGEGYWRAPWLDEPVRAEVAPSGGAGGAGGTRYNPPPGTFAFTGKDWTDMPRPDEHDEESPRDLAEAEDDSAGTRCEMCREIAPVHEIEDFDAHGGDRRVLRLCVPCMDAGLSMRAEG